MPIRSIRGGTGIAAARRASRSSPACTTGGCGRCSRCPLRRTAPPTASGLTSSTRRWSARGIGGATRSSTRCERRDRVISRAPRLRWRGSPGRTTGSWARRLAGSRGGWAPVLRRLLQELAELWLRDWLGRRAHAFGEQLEEYAQSRVVQVDGRSDHLGGGALATGFDDLK